MHNYSRLIVISVFVFIFCSCKKDLAINEYPELEGLWYAYENKGYGKGNRSSHSFEVLDDGSAHWQRFKYLYGGYAYEIAEEYYGKAKLKDGFLYLRREEFTFSPPVLITDANGNDRYELYLGGNKFYLEN